MHALNARLQAHHESEQAEAAALARLRDQQRQADAALAVFTSSSGDSLAVPSGTPSEQMAWIQRHHATDRGRAMVAAESYRSQLAVTTGAAAVVDDITINSSASAAAAHDDAATADFAIGEMDEARQRELDAAAAATDDAMLVAARDAAARRLAVIAARAAAREQDPGSGDGGHAIQNLVNPATPAPPRDGVGIATLDEEMVAKLVAAARVEVGATPAPVT
jgi:hypothetical protein